VHTKILLRTKLVGVRLGEWDMTSNPDCDASYVNEEVCAPPVNDYGIEELIIHEKYSPTSFNQHNDLALIRLSQKVKFNDFVRPICLQSNSALRNANVVGQSLVVTGFGRTESATSSNVKLKATLGVVDISKCNEIFRQEGRRVVDTQLCVGGVKSIDSCRGDSG